MPSPRLHALFAVLVAHTACNSSAQVKPPTGGTQSSPTTAVVLPPTPVTGATGAPNSVGAAGLAGATIALVGTAPKLQVLPRGATFALARIAGSSGRLNLPGRPSADAGGSDVFRLGVECTGTCKDQLAAALKEPTGARQLIQLRGDVLDVLPRAGRPADALGADFARAVGGSVDSAEQAALLVWLAGYDVVDAHVDRDDAGYVVTGQIVRSTCAERTVGGSTAGEAVTSRERVHVSSAGELRVDSTTRTSAVAMPCAARFMGRLPEGVVVDVEAVTLRGYLVGAAQLEAVSVDAFARLAGDLVTLHAPMALVAAAQRAAQDEVYHASIMGELAKREGAIDAELTPPSVPPRGPRSLFDFARENVVEGCVRETFAALVATYQAQHADTAALRSTYARIAEDESAHAELAWQVDAWCRSQLDARACAALDRARSEAARDLAAALGAQAQAPACVGEPPAAVAVALLEQMVAAVPAAMAQAA